MTISLVIAALSVLAGCMTTDLMSEESRKVTEGYAKAGSVSVEKRVWNWFFMKSPEQRRSELIAEAERKAKETYGDDAVLVNHRIESRWNPYSLLLCFDLIGFVEDGSLSADVLLPAPPPPEPEPEPQRIVEVTYTITPQERFDDEYGYIALEYFTRPEVIEQIKARLDKRGAEPEEYDKAYAEVPEGGQLVVNIGRKDLMHANTQWYSYLVTSDDSVITRKQGKEGIPNIKGRDGNWWNVVTIPLTNPISGTITVQVNDNEAELSYEFSISRVERLM